MVLKSRNEGSAALDDAADNIRQEMRFDDVASNVRLS
jgi:hypothetical protein